MDQTVDNAIDAFNNIEVADWFYGIPSILTRIIYCCKNDHVYEFPSRDNNAKHIFHGSSQ